jgi:hypothetical protein
VGLAIVSNRVGSRVMSAGVLQPWMHHPRGELAKN